MSAHSLNEIPQEELDRLPPHSEEAESAVLGSIMLDARSVMPICVVRIGAEIETFYVLKHQYVYTAMVEMYDAEEPIDVITLAEYLDFQNRLEEVGGHAFLAGLQETTQSAGNITAYLDILRERFRAREALRFVTELSSGVTGKTGQIDTLIERTAAHLISLSQSQMAEEDTPIRQLVDEALADMEAWHQNRGEVTGLSTGLIDLDRITTGLHGGEMIVIAARPSMGKTSLGMNIAEHVACDLGKPVGVFSLEMSKKSLITRMICSRARVNLRHLKEGFMAERDFPKITSAAGAIARAPLYLNDISGLSILGLRARARRMFQMFGIKLFVIDYLQLLHAERSKQDNRQQEVSVISGGIKNLAKDLDVPVIVMAQLNRGIEKDKNRKPQLSDLRECLSVGSTLLFTDSGVRRNSSSRMNTYSLSTSAGNAVLATPSEDIPKGTGKLFRVKLDSGRFIDCTAKHEILTDRGWCNASKLTREHSIASARSLIQPDGVFTIPEAKWIGWMLGNGSMVGYSSPSFICSDKTVADDFCKTTHRIFGLVPKPHKHKNSLVFQYDITAGHVRTPAGNPCKDWLKAQDLWGRRAPEKVIPDWFMQNADNDSIAEMVAGLWETDGTITRGIAKFCTTSKQLAWQVVWCLARLGIFCYIDDGYLSDKARFPCFTIKIADGRDVVRFRNQVHLVGAKGFRMAELTPSQRGSNCGDRLGLWVSASIKNTIDKLDVSYAKFGYRPQGKRISQSDLSRLIGKNPALGYLAHLVNPAIYWDRLESLKPIGSGKLFDRSVTKGAPNFVANGIIVHNSGSIEQDADLVGMLYIPRGVDETDDQQEAQDTTPTNLYIAKQRNGPTGDLSLVFRKGYTRFECAARIASEDYPPETAELPLRSQEEGRAQQQFPD